MSLIVTEHNYGWPLTPKGMHHNGKLCDGDGLGLDVPLDEINPH